MGRATEQRVIEFSTDVLRPQDRYPFWRDLVGNNFQEADLSLERDDRLRFSGSMVMRHYGDFEIVESRSTAHETIQSKNFVSHVDDNYLWVYQQLESREVALFDTVDDVHLSPGDMYIYHPVLPSRLKPLDQIPSRTRLYRFHKRHLASIGGKLPDYVPTRKVSGEGGAARLLTAYLGTLASELPGLDSFAADMALNAFYGLVAAAYGAVDGNGEPISTAVERGRLNLARKLIDRHSSNPALSAAIVAENMRLSERTLQRAFEVHGDSFTLCLRRIRLDKCKRALRDPAAAGQLISTIAYANGFDSLATFNRQFQQAFGLTPREWRQGEG